MKRPRPPKASGYASFQQAVANNLPDIIDADLDIDADTLYNLVNGQLDDANINTDFSGPGIDYRKLALAGKIQLTDLAGAPFAAPTILTPLSVTTPLLAIGASVNGAVSASGGSIAAPTVISPAGGERMLLEATYQSRGGHYRAAFLAAIAGEWDPAIQSTDRIMCQIRLGGTPGDPTTGIVIGTQSIGTRTSGVSPSPLTAPWSLTVLAFPVGEFYPLVAGTQDVKFTSTMLSGSANILAFSYQLIGCEFA